MRIIKNGKIETEVEFSCQECKCIFIADLEEYEKKKFTYKYYNEEISKFCYYCTCPCCGILVKEVRNK